MTCRASKNAHVSVLCSQCCNCWTPSMAGENCSKSGWPCSCHNCRITLIEVTLEVAYEPRTYLKDAHCMNSAELLPILIWLVHENSSTFHILARSRIPASCRQSPHAVPAHHAFKVWVAADTVIFFWSSVAQEVLLIKDGMSKVADQSICTWLPCRKFQDNLTCVLTVTLEMFPYLHCRTDI